MDWNFSDKIPSLMEMIFQRTAWDVWEEFVKVMKLIN